MLEDYIWLLFNSEKDLEKIIGKLLEDERLCKKIGRKLREKVEKEYTWEKTAERVKGVYGKLI